MAEKDTTVKTDVKTEEKDTKVESAKKADTKPKAKNDIMGDGSDDGDLILENERVSINLTPENATFKRSGGDLISLDIINDKGEPESFERVVILRSFPVTNPNEFLSVREPDSKKQGRGKEIGMIRYMSTFDEATQALFKEELDRRYFTPEIKKINSVKDKFGYLYWDVVTTAGNVTFVLNNPFSNIRILEDGRILINDIDGNVFEILEPQKLDSASLKKIEIYL
ncbi:MAG: DUF1854 domain-containing protein [Clostridiales bacterium]|nr:DUF1854 domain-containing protein [Clostridiales bacterium]